jgi:hypothetical protein
MNQKGLREVLSCNFPEQIEENHKETSLRVADVLAKIQRLPTQTKSVATKPTTLMECEHVFIICKESAFACGSVWV